MAEQFYTILTKIGKAKVANATALGIKVNFCKMQVGDSNGSYYNPTEDQTELRHKVWEGNINNIRVEEENPNWIFIETMLPSNVGGFMIREAAILDDENNIVAVAKYPETYKPQTQDGSSKEILIRTILEVSNTETVTLKLDPTTMLATKKDIQILENKINNLDGKAVRLRNHIILDADTTKIPIGISEFNINDDIEVFINGRFLSKGINYKIAESNTEIENMDSQILWQNGDEIDICVNKNIKNEVNTKDHIDVGLIPEGSITENKLNPQFVNKVTKIQEDLANIDLAANKVKLNRITGINATEVQGAIQELFQFADSGKKSISNVIGSPLSATDAFSTMQSKIQTLKNALAINLNNKKQSSSGTENLSTLIDKVDRVEVGVKSAYGIERCSAEQEKITNTYTTYTVSVSGLSFKPDIVALCNGWNYANPSYAASVVYVDKDILKKIKDVSSFYDHFATGFAYSSDSYHVKTSSTRFFYRSSLDKKVLYDGGFKVPVPYNVDIYTADYAWFAFKLK